MTKDRREDPPYTEEMLGETKLLVTRCPGCPSSYAIDEGHWDYARIRAALDRGDRSVLLCYHHDGALLEILNRPRSGSLPN
jgi:hypothetical protein